MSMPFYTLAIVVCIKGLKDSDDIYMQCNRLVPFIPQDGMTLELWRETEEGEDTYRLELTGVYYSLRESMFIAEQEDTDLMEAARAGEAVHSDREEFVEWYKSFGFKRLNYPTGQVIHNDRA